MRPLLLLLLPLLAAPLGAQRTPEPPRTLAQTIASIAGNSASTVAVSCSLPGTPLACDLNAENHPPMQSVFKFPLALTVLHLVEQGKFTLDQPIRFLPSDRILPTVHSPLQAKYPAANVDIPLRDLIGAATTVSDNVAADILLRILGGPGVVQAYIQSLGIKDFNLVDNEQALHQDNQNQFRNWISPHAAVQLLRLFADNSPLNPANTELLSGFMEAPSTSPAHRIKAGVPPGAVVRHKTGSSDTVLGVTYANNDIGLITLPDGRNLALAIFLTNSTDDDKERDITFADLTRAIYDAAIHP